MTAASPAPPPSFQSGRPARSSGPLRFLAAVPGSPATLALSAGLSLLGALGTALAFVQAAEWMAALLRGPAPMTPPYWSVALGLGLRAAAAAARDALTQAFAARAVRTWRERLTDAALALGPVALAGRRTADLLALSAELGPRLTPLFARYLPGRAHAALSGLVALTVTAWLDPATAGVLLVTGLLTVVFLWLVGLATHAATDAQWAQHTRLNARLLTLTRHLGTLHAFGAVNTYRDVLVRSAAAQRGATLRVLRVAFLSGFVLEFAATLSTALVAVWIGVRLFSGEVTLAPTLAALMLVPEFFGPLRQLGADRHAALDAEPLSAQLQALLSVPRAPQGDVRLPEGPLTLSLTGARAALPGLTATLDAHLSAGAHVALLGPSGSGKSALLHALGKYVGHDGEILVNGAPLNSLQAQAWAGRVALVPQHPRLLAASVRENLRLLAPHTADPAVQRAVDAVGLRATVDALPRGLDEPLGEGGTLLSGGETARLGLARALLAGADLLLLDEVTAHLDDETAQDVHRLVARAAAGRTVVLVTHRAPPPGWPVLHLKEAGA